MQIFSLTQKELETITQSGEKPIERAADLLVSLPVFRQGDKYVVIADRADKWQFSGVYHCPECGHSGYGHWPNCKQSSAVGSP